MNAQDNIVDVDCNKVVKHVQTDGYVGATFYEVDYCMSFYRNKMSNAVHKINENAFLEFASEFDVSTRKSGYKLERMIIFRLTEEDIYTSVIKKSPSGSKRSNISKNLLIIFNGDLSLENAIFSLTPITGTQDDLAAVSYNRRHLAPTGKEVLLDNLSIEIKNAINEIIELSYTYYLFEEARNSIDR